MRVGGPKYRDWHAQRQRRGRERAKREQGAAEKRARIEGKLMGLALREALEAHDAEDKYVRSNLARKRMYDEVGLWGYVAQAGQAVYRRWIPTLDAIRALGNEDYK